MFYISCIEQENNVDDDFNEDLRNFLVSYFRINMGSILFRGINNTN